MDPNYDIGSDQLKLLLRQIKDAGMRLDFIQPMTHGKIQNLLKNKRKHWRKA